MTNSKEFFPRLSSFSLPTYIKKYRLSLSYKMSFSLSSGENVLFVAPATVDQSTFVQVKSSAQDQVGPTGTTAFEVFDRVAEGIFFCTRNKPYKRVALI